MKAYLIARVSTEDQKDALPAQVHRLLDYASRQNYEHTLIQIKESAYSGNRDEFKAVIKQIQSETEPIAVVFDKVDRLSRDSSAEEVRQLHKMSRSGDIELHFPSESLIVNSSSPATDIMRLGLNVVLAQYYSDAISDNVRRRNEQMRRDGLWTGRAPSGYRNTVKADKTKWIDVEPLEAKAIKEIYELYASGNHTLRTIRKKIIEEHGYVMGISFIAKILGNPFYMGVMRVKGKEYPHKYVPLVTKELYDRVQAVRAGFTEKPRRYAGLPYPYRGLISCAICGCCITFEKKKQTYVYGHCTQFKGKHGASYVNEDELTAQLQTMFASFTIPDDAMAFVSTELRRLKAEEIAKSADTLQYLNAEIKKYDTRLARIYDDYLDRKISEEFHDSKAREFQESKAVLIKRKSTFELSVNDDYGTISHLLNLANKAPELFKSADLEEKRSLINTVLSNLQLSGKLLRWELKKPFNTMAFCSETGNWQGHVESNHDLRFWRPLY
jgi:site-specific DNA recombinase